MKEYVNKTKKQLQSEETKKNIIAVASDLLISKGYVGTSISEIARAANLTKGALYHHFKNKEDLVFGIIRSVRKTWSQQVGKMALKERNSISRLQRMFLAHNELLNNDATICLVMSSLISEIEALNPSFKSEIKNMYNEMLIFIEKIIIKGQNQNEIKRGLDAKNVAFAMVGMLRWLGCSPLYKLMDFNRNAAVDVVQELFLGNIKE